ncbi:MAG: DUF1801 domain-containing protein [Alphaproteobacteria bacterium]|nr:DUF1801 domain-containing protein [Alphaproteobacteria bacterium]
MSSDALLARYPPAVAETAAAVRRTLLDVFPAIEETPDESAGVIGYGDGPGYKGLVATIILSKKGVKLGLSGGASLPDPDGLLAGSGKVHRYVEMACPADADRPALRRLIEAARAVRAARGG